MPQPIENTLRFEGFTLDLARGLLSSGDNEIKLRPKSFEVLKHLANNAGRLVGKEELVAAVWGRAVVTDESIARCISDIRAALGDAAGRIIATAPRRGYRFAAPVETVARPEIAAPGRPRLSLVVLPFVNLGGGPEQEPFVDGVTDSLTTDLSRIRGAFVIARNTAFTYKGKAVDLKEVGRELNVRYVLEGSVQRAGARMRVNVQLIDAESGNHLWADRFDKPVGDLFDMQDEIVARLAGALNAELIAAEARRAERGPNPDSVDLVLQAKAAIFQGMGPKNMARARDLCDRALALDPGDVEALITSAWADEAEAFHVADSRALFAVAEAKLTQALKLVPNHAGAHVELGLVYVCSRRAAQGIAECEHALSLDRNLAAAHGQIGLGKMFVGRFEETEAHVLEAVRLSPRDPVLYAWMMTAGAAKNLLGRWQEAEAWCRRAIEANRSTFSPYCELAIALANLDRLDEARSAIAAGMEIVPEFSLSYARAAWTAMSNHPRWLEQIELQLQVLRGIGVPE